MTPVMLSAPRGAKARPRPRPMRQESSILRMNEQDRIDEHGTLLQKWYSLLNRRELLSEGAHV